MRILLIHSDYLNYNVKNKTPVAEDIEEAKKEGSFVMKLGHCKRALQSHEKVST